MTPERRKICRIILALLTASIVLFAFFFYSYFLEIKRTFVSVLSARASSFSGHKVDIANISLDLPGDMILQDISIHDPALFGHGELLRIKRLSMDMDLRDLLKGRLHFRSIVLDSPELSLKKNAAGRFNISGKLLKFLSEKSTLSYTVDSIRINKGGLDFNSDAYIKNKNINLEISGMSSVPGTKTSIKGSTVYIENSIEFQGWAYLADKPKKFNLSVSARDFSPVAFRDLLAGYRIDIAKTKTDLDLKVEGDTEKGASFTSALQLKETGFSFSKKHIEDIFINADAFFNMHDNSLVINDLFLHTNDGSSARMKGTLTNIRKEPSYSAEVIINRLDLASINFMKSVRLRGIIASDRIDIRGKLDMSMPYISGFVRLEGATVTSPEIDIEKMSATVKFLSDKEITVKTEATAGITRAGGYKFLGPAGIEASIEVRKDKDKADILSSLVVSHLAIDAGGGKSLIAGSINVGMNGSARGLSFSGKNILQINGLEYDKHKIQQLQSVTGIRIKNDLLELTGLNIEADRLKTSSGVISVKMSEGREKYYVSVKELNATYPEKDSVIKGAGLAANLYLANKSVSGDIKFSAQRMTYLGVEAGPITGSGWANNKDFHMDISAAVFSGGRAGCTADGKTGGGFFPIRIRAKVENVDAAPISAAAAKSVKMRYTLAGDIKGISFDGTMDSVDVIHGNALMQAGKISVINGDTKKGIMKDASLNAEMIFKGKDLELRADATAGKIKAGFSGLAKDFMTNERAVKIDAIIPEIKASDLRDSLWDMFPDGLLYSGLEGSLSSKVSANYDKSGTKLEGNIKLKDFTLTGENSEYSVGPINGTVPIIYNSSDTSAAAPDLPSFEYPDFSSMSRHYADMKIEEGSDKITIGSIRYGFRLLDDITIFLKQKGPVLNIERLSGNIFGGKLTGSAVLAISDSPAYSAGLIIEGLSLKQLCEDIEPIKGYISGKVDGVGYMRGTGIGLSHLIGKADFRTYGAKDEKTRISKEFIRKIGGPSIKTYVGDRNFNKGIMGLYIQDGFIIFRDLDISNRNLFGITDLSLKVAPLNNRISIEHLMWTIEEAAQRAKKE